MSVSRKCSGAGFAGWLPSGRYYWSFWWLGLINNLGYVVVLSSAKSLAASFDAGDSIGAINWVLVGLGMVVRLLNMYGMGGVRFRTRVATTAAGFGLGVGGLWFVTRGLTNTSAPAVAAAVQHQRWPFSAALLAILALGGACSFGESVLLGYLRSFPRHALAGFGGGTGMAGAGGALGYLALSGAMGLSDSTIYLLLLLPSTLLYVAIFARVDSAFEREWGHEGIDAHAAASAARMQGAEQEMVDAPVGRQSRGYSSDAATKELQRQQEQREEEEEDDKEEEETLLGGGGNNNSGSNDGSGTAKTQEEQKPRRHHHHHQQQQQQQQQQPEAWPVRTIRCVALVRRYAMHLAAVYFLEYVIQVAGASLSSGGAKDTGAATAAKQRMGMVGQLHGGSEGDGRGDGGGSGGGGSAAVLREHSFALLAFAYQIGVLVSRSLSLSLLPVRRIELLTAAQAVLFVWWAAQARWLLWGLGAQVACMACVGLMGGAMYVNVFALINGDCNIPEGDREFCINVVALAVNLGIVGASIFDLVAVPLVHAAQVRDHIAAG